MREELSRQNGPPPTINDVAAQAGVSKKTVSRVINRSPLLSEATRTKVEEVIRDLGFVPNPQARALALRRNFMIVLLHDNPNGQTVLNFQRGVLNAIEDSDLALVVKPVDRHSPDMLADVQTFLERQRPLGAMLLAVVAEACRHLIAQGHRNIGFVRGPEGFRSSEEREAGFRAAMAEANLQPDPALCVTGTYRFGSGLATGEILLSSNPRPTAIFVSNDEMAAGVMHVAHRMGLVVPKDISIIGFDDSPTASQIWPALSTVRWPITEMGSLAAHKLVPEFLVTANSPESATETVLDSTYIERDSVGPAPV
jgi:LacI family transcriptional regulator